MAAELNDGKIFPGSGLDRDNDLLAIEGADSRYRLNVILSEDTNYQVLSNVKGNTERTYTLPAGTNVIKGFVEDKENKAGIYFIHNSNNNHSIVRFNSEDNSFTTILGSQSAILPAWPWDGFVDAGNDLIGNEDEQFLVWADGRDLHMINIQYAIDGNYNSTITQEEISFYKAPIYATSGRNIEVDYVNIAPTFTADIYDKIFQFAIRLKYYDNTLSVLSNYSEIAFPEENIPSGRNSSDKIFNYINVNYSIHNEPSIISKIQLLYRIVDIGGGTPGSWFVYQEKNYDTKGPSNFQFKNDKSIGVVSDAEAVRPYDFVPDIVNHVGIIDSNRVVVDVGREGYDNVALDVSVDVVDSAIPSSSEGVVSSSEEELNPGNSVQISQPVNSALDYYIQIDVISGSTHYLFSIYTYNLTGRSEEHTSELQSHSDLVCRLLLEKKNKTEYE